MKNLHDVLQIENNNLEDACHWVERILNDENESPSSSLISTWLKDEEITHIKNVFVEGLEYLRDFKPDADDLFGKKVRFSPGDDASKLPNAILNFGELTVSLPGFTNRYFPLEEQYLPRPFRIGMEADAFKGRFDEPRLTSTRSK